MIFNGDLSKYHPADAIMFLSQLGLNGVFSIVVDQRVIALGFQNGNVINAQSSRGDAKILQALIFRRYLSAEQVQHIRRIQTEAGISIRAILAQLAFFPLADIADILLLGMQEVLLEVFLLEHGAFHFTDTPIDPDGGQTRLDAGSVAIRFAAQSDEFRDFEKSIISLDRGYTLVEKSESEHLSADTQMVLRVAGGCRSVRQLIEKVPLDSHAAMEIIREQIERETLVLLPPANERAPSPSGLSLDPLFGAFRQAMKKMMLTRDPLKQLEALVNFCRAFYDGMLILTARDGHVVHCKKIIRLPGQGAVQHSYKGQLGSLAQDAVAHAVSQSGVGFIGETFPSGLLDRLSGESPAGECALIPIITQGHVSVLLYAFTRKTFDGLSPQHYLELLSWMPGAGDQRANRLKNMAGRPDEATDTPVVASKGRSAPERLVAMVDDLPPLPTLVTQALDLLADPDSSVQALEAVIEKDQSLVSKLIRVSNSALFGGLKQVESLQQALSRLGSKTTKSLILTASMQSYFLETHPHLKSWGEALWQHAAECGLAARRIATATKFDDPEKAFVGGVVHDIGKLVIMLTGSDAYRQIQNLRRQDLCSSIAAERQVIGTDHVAIGVLLMDKWKMPASAKLCVAYHHTVQQANGDRPLAAIAAYANLLSHCHGAQGQSATPAMQAEIAALITELGLTEDQNEVLIASTTVDFQNSGLL